MRLVRRIAIVLGALAIGSVSLSGCASSSAVAANADVPVASEFQLKALSDGQIDREEYLAGFGNYQSCMSELGYDVLVMDDKSTVIDIRIPAAGVESGADERCYLAEFNQIDDAWQLANQDSREDNAVLAACMAINGLVRSADSAPTSRQEKIDELVSANIDLASCFTK